MVKRADTIAVPHRDYPFTDDMAEIIGYGYEIACRQMVQAGLEWLDAHPSANPEFKDLRERRVIVEMNDDAEGLMCAFADAVHCYTYAMGKVAIDTCMWIRANGWNKFVIKTCRTKREKDSSDKVRWR